MLVLMIFIIVDAVELYPKSIEYVIAGSKSGTYVSLVSTGPMGSGDHIHTEV